MTARVFVDAATAYLVTKGHTRETFAQTFPVLFQDHFDRLFDETNDHDLMLAEVTLGEAFGWLGDGGKVYR